MLHPIQLIDVVKARQNELSKQVEAYRLPKETQAGHQKSESGFLSRIADLVSF